MNYTEKMYEEDIGMVLPRREPVKMKAPESDLWLESVAVVGSIIGVILLCLWKVQWVAQ